MRFSDSAQPGPGLKWLFFFLVSGLLAKVLVSATFLAPPALWAWAGPRVSEAATPAAGSLDSPALPRLANLLSKERQALTSRESAMAAKEEQLRLLKREVEERLGELKVLQSRVMDSIEEEKRQKGEHNRHLVATLEAMPPDKAAQAPGKAGGRRGSSAPAAPQGQGGRGHPGGPDSGQGGPPEPAAPAVTSRRSLKG